MSDLGDLYQEVILDHSRSPHNFGTLPSATHNAKGHNPLCGDQVTIHLLLKDNRIEDLRFEGNGCAISKSSASVMTDTVKGKTREEVEALFNQFHALVTNGDKSGLDETDRLSVFSGVSEFPTRVKCAVLAWHTLKSAMDNKQTPVVTE